MKRKKWWLIPIIIVGSVQALLLVFAFVLFTQKFTVRDNNISHYEKYCKKTGQAEEYLPSLEEVYSYQPNNMLFSYQETTQFFTSYGIALFVDYNDEAYQMIVNDYETNSYFLTDEEIEKELASDYCQFPIKEFDYKNYHFKIEAHPYYDSGYKSCKSFMFVGFDDGNSNIAYLYFYDIDIDYTYEPKKEVSTIDRETAMTQMIKDYFYWRDL